VTLVTSAEPRNDERSGRWTTTDPYGGSMTIADPQSFNRYSYVNNDPVNQVDPSGLMLSDIGVYQTSSAAVAGTLERVIDALVKKNLVPHPNPLCRPHLPTMRTHHLFTALELMALLGQRRHPWI
jgi:hypothetical protein